MKAFHKGGKRHPLVDDDGDDDDDERCLALLLLKGFVNPSTSVRSSAMGLGFWVGGLGCNYAFCKWISKRRKACYQAIWLRDVAASEETGEREEEKSKVGERRKAKAYVRLELRSLMALEELWLTINEMHKLHALRVPLGEISGNVYVCL